MAYRVEKNGDLVIDGFENGIADSQYKGISDIRNIDITSVPGEAPVGFSTSLNSPLGVVNVTSANTGTEVVSGTVTSGTLFNGMAVTFAGGSLPTGIVAGTQYWIGTVTSTTGATTFQVFTLPDLAAPHLVNITATGTGTMTAVTMGKVKYYSTEILGPTAAPAFIVNYYAVDDNGRVWARPDTANASGLPVGYTGGWVFLNNSTSNGVGQGMTQFNGYLLNFRSNAIDYIQTYDYAGGGSLSLFSNTWTVNWQPDGPNVLNTVNPLNRFSHETLIGPTDGILYYCDGSFLGSLQNLTDMTSDWFDPGDGTTYTWNRKAFSLQLNDAAQCLGYSGTNVLIGGISNLIYVWDRIATGYFPIFISEISVFRMVTADTNTYIFAGNRGRIFVTNGVSANLYKKVPDHLSGTISPYFTWGGACVSRNQLYFGLQSFDNAGVAISQYGGLWALDLNTQVIRLVNQFSYGTYAGLCSAVTPVLATTSNPTGYGLWMGWGTSTGVGGIDTYNSTPYTGGQAYVDSDLIPVGTFEKNFTPSQFEWKTSVPLATSESVALYYRTNFSASYTLIPTVNSITTKVSDLVQSNFQQAQWVQIRAILTSTSSSPTYCRLTEIRMRNLKEK